MPQDQLALPLHFQRHNPALYQDKSTRTVIGDLLNRGSEELSLWYLKRAGEVEGVLIDALYTHTPQKKAGNGLSIEPTEDLAVIRQFLLNLKKNKVFGMNAGDEVLLVPMVSNSRADYALRVSADLVDLVDGNGPQSAKDILTQFKSSGRLKLVKQDLDTGFAKVLKEPTLGKSAKLTPAHAAVVSAAGDEYNRYGLNIIAWTNGMASKGMAGALVASDGNRLEAVRMPEPPRSLVLMPVEAIEAGSNSIEATQSGCRVGPWLSTNVNPNQFPDWQQVIPSFSGFSQKAVIPIHTMQQIITNKPAGASEGMLYVLKGKLAALWGSGQLDVDQEHKDKVLAPLPVNFKGSGDPTTFNVLYLFDIFRLMMIGNDKSIEWMVSDDLGPSVLTLHIGKNLERIAVVMPIRVIDRRGDKDTFSEDKEKFNAKYPGMVQRWPIRPIAAIKAKPPGHLPPAPAITGSALATLLKSTFSTYGNIVVTPMNGETWFHHGNTEKHSRLVRVPGHIVPEAGFIMAGYWDNLLDSLKTFRDQVVTGLPIKLDPTITMKPTIIKQGVKEEPITLSASEHYPLVLANLGEFSPVGMTKDVLSRIVAFCKARDERQVGAWWCGTTFGATNGAMAILHYQVAKNPFNTTSFPISIFQFKGEDLFASKEFAASGNLIVPVMSDDQNASAKTELIAGLLKDIHQKAKLRWEGAPSVLLKQISVKNTGGGAIHATEGKSTIVYLDESAEKVLRQPASWAPQAVNGHAVDFVSIMDVKMMTAMLNVFISANVSDVCVEIARFEKASMLSVIGGNWEGVLMGKSGDDDPPKKNPNAGLQVITACNVVSRTCGNKKGPILLPHPSAQSIQKWLQWNDGDGDYGGVHRLSDEEALNQLIESWDPSDIAYFLSKHK